MKNWQRFYVEKNRIKFWVLLGLFFVVVVGASLGIGVVKVSPHHLVMALLGEETSSVGARIILYTRLPRMVASVLSGAALAVSGVIIQTVLHNPLASPGIIGVNAGAGFLVSILCALIPMAQMWTPLIAFAGAFLGVMFVLGLAERTGASRMTVVLAGVAISQLFSAGIDMVVTIVPDALAGVSDFRIGGFSGVTMKELELAGGVIGVSLLLVFTLAQQLEILGLGNDTAESIGMNVKRMRTILLILAAALSGAAVSFSGLIGFVGLIVPHMMRRMIGEESLPLLMASAVGGATFVTLCDLLARIVFAPYELPVGIVLAFIGAPFFLWLLFQQKGGRV